MPDETNATDLQAAADLAVPDPATAPPRKPWEPPAMMSDNIAHAGDVAGAQARRYAARRNADAARRRAG